MRILRLITRPNVGGPMRQAIALWGEHRWLGHRTLIVTGVCEPDEAGIDLRALDIPLLDPRAAVAAGNDAEGVCVIGSMQRSLQPWRDLSTARVLRKLLRSFAPDVVHTHTSKAGWLGRRAARRAGVPCVAHTFHGHVLADYAGRWASGAVQRVERRLALDTHLLFGVSDSCCDELTALGISPRILRIHPAVATEAFAKTERNAARAALGIDANTVLLGFVGRMVPIKQPMLFAELCRALPEVRGIMVGDGPLRAELTERAALSGGRLSVIGTTARPEALVSGFDALVLPSIREGFPIVGVEAAAAGVPTLGFDVPGLSDLDAALGGGHLVPASAGLGGLIAQARSFVSAGCPRVCEKGAELAAACAPSKVARDLSEAYGRVLAGSGHRRRGALR